MKMKILSAILSGLLLTSMSIQMNADAMPKRIHCGSLTRRLWELYQTRFGFLESCGFL